MARRICGITEGAEYAEDTEKTPALAFFVKDYQHLCKTFNRRYLLRVFRVFREFRTHRVLRDSVPKSALSDDSRLLKPIGYILEIPINKHNKTKCPNIT